MDDVYGVDSKNIYFREKIGDGYNDYKITPDNICLPATDDELFDWKRK